MIENDKTDTSRSISDEELMKNEVIGDDADLLSRLLSFGHSWKGIILGLIFDGRRRQDILSPPFFIPVSSDDYRRRAARPHPVTTPASPRA